MAKKISRRELERRARQRADAMSRRVKRTRADARNLADELADEASEALRFRSREQG